MSTGAPGPGNGDDCLAGLPSRVAALLATIGREGGQWTTKRVGRAHRANGFDAPQRSTHRMDLKDLERRGFLLLHDHDRTRRYYTLNPWKDGME